MKVPESLHGGSSIMTQSHKNQAEVGLLAAGQQTGSDVPRKMLSIKGYKSACKLLPKYYLEVDLSTNRFLHDGKGIHRPRQYSI